jgi:ribosomal protein L24E
MRGEGDPMRIIKCDYCASAINPSSEEKITQGELDWCEEYCLKMWRMYRAPRDQREPTIELTDRILAENKRANCENQR